MRIIISILGITFLLFESNVYAMDAVTIVKKALHAVYYQAKDMKAQIDMRIIDKQGRERKRRLTLLRKNVGNTDGSQKYYVFFHKPADVNKMVFMAWKNIKQSDDRWLYLPAMDLVKRIASSDERSSFVGSHFYYEDISGRLVDEDNHQLLNEKNQHYVIKSVAKDKTTVEFSYYKMWVNKITFIPMKIEYFNSRNVVYRTYRTLKIATIDGYPTVIQAQMKDSRTAGQTLLDYSNIQYSLGFPEKIFTERYLRKAPKKYLR